MATLVFICEEHREFGGNGWRPEKYREFDPLDGMAVAHDLLEHFPKGDTSTAHEVMAFGASLFVRKDYYSHKAHGVNRPSENFAGEIGDMLRKIFWSEVGRIADCPYRRNVRGNEYVNAEINHAIAKLREWLESETDGDIDRSMKLETQDEQNIRGWLAEGYRRAVRRYRGIDSWTVQNVFEQIEKRADEILKHAEIGDKLTVRAWKRKRPRWSELDFSIRHQSVWDLGEEY